MIDPRLEAHDANQLELKLSYLVEPGVKRQHYLVETHLFVPRTLGVSGQSYGTAGFFEDTQTFVRLKTPTVALEALAKTGRGERWFSPVRSELDRLLSGDTALRKGAINGLVRSLKLLASIYRSAVRDEGRMLQQKFLALESDVEGATMREQEIARHLTTFIEHLEAALARFRHVGNRCEHAIVPQVVRETWSAVDEYVAIYVEDTATGLVGQCDERLRRSADSPLAGMRERLADIAIAAYKYRRSHGYPSYAVPGASNEDLPRRIRILKRIVSSVLYLDLRHEEGGVLQKDIIAGVAAAIAMLFAVVVSLWAQSEWGAVSGTFIAIAVASYIIKDRLKDWGKRYLGRRFARWVPDYVTDIRSPDSDEVIGQCREAVRVVDAVHVDPAIMELRHTDHPSEVALHGRPEVVVRYVKEVMLDSDGLQKAMEGVEGLNDIIRLNFARFRQRMDEPIEVRKIVHPTNRSVVAVPCARVYHINVILKITRGEGRKDASSWMERVRVVLDAEGLKRVESVGAATGARAPADALMGVSLESAQLVTMSSLPGQDRAHHVPAGRIKPF
ncbi:MAG: hypothetical protein U1F43_18125 [Myxococcota bacterium]